MKHEKYDEIKTLVKHGMNVLLSGPAGSGKSTIIKNISTELDLPMYTMPMTKQTTLNSLLGFISINGNYIPSQLRKAVEEGGIMLLDELDGSDPNTVLCLNTLENGYLACPDGNINVHKDFHLCATANPSNEHQIYTGRSKLDGATLDRFEEVEILRDNELEILLTCEETNAELNTMRGILSYNNVSKTLSMRDAIRFKKRKDIGLAKGYEFVLLGEHDFVKDYHIKMKANRPKKVLTQSECTNIDDLWEVVNTPGKSQPKVPTPEEYNTALEHAKRFVAINTMPPGVKAWEVGLSPDNPFHELIKINLNGKTYEFKKEDL